VSQHIADYIACVRARGAQLGEARASKLQADAKVAGVGTSVLSDVSDKLERKYADSSEANELEIIRACRALNGGGEAVVAAQGADPPACPVTGASIASGNAPSWNGSACVVMADCTFGDAAECTSRCDAGDVPSCENLSWMYHQGVGVARDHARAASLAQRACEGRNAIACNNLGYFLEHGYGVARDDVRSTGLYRRSCDASDPLGCNNLGRAYDAGRGVPADPVRAAELYRRACDSGNQDGCANLGWCLANGRGVAQDRARGLELMRSTCKGGNAYSCDRIRELGETP
jgi:TPR repeat protein